MSTLDSAMVRLVLTVAHCLHAAGLFRKRPSQGLKFQYSILLA